MTGVAVGGVGLALGLGLFYMGQGRTDFEENVQLTTDFGMITGLRKGSRVQVAGVDIGGVTSIDFYEATYQCDPMAEDYGRSGQGRRDDCDPQLFCSPEGSCARLERWGSEDDHPLCINDAECGMEAVCVTRPFRRRYARAYWAGGDNVCARFLKTHNRVRVTMSIGADKLSLIRETSRAKVSSNSVLGDQLIEITRGSGTPVSPGGRVQSLPSFYEDLENVRDRVEIMLVKADRGLGAISDVFGDLNDERVIAKMKDRIASLNEATSDVAEARGSIGGLFGDQALEDLGGALQTSNKTATEVDSVMRKANVHLAEINRELQPKIDDARQTMAGMRGKLTDIRDPEANHDMARLLYDESGHKLAEVRGDVREVAETVTDIDGGKGALGQLVNANVIWDETLKILGFTGRSDSFRAAVREALERSER